MSAWKFGSFENDDASDWLYELESSSDTSAIEEALEPVSTIGDGYLEAPECSVAIAACEVIAALRGNPMAALPDIAKLWVTDHAATNILSLVPVALAALERIRTNSELKELWDESDEADQWQESLDDLIRRLKA